MPKKCINLRFSTEEQDAAGAAGSTDIKGDFSIKDDPRSWIVSFNCSIRLRASSHVSRTS